MLPGRVWSVVAGSGWGGRVVPEVFPIEVWPYSGDCPVEGAPGATPDAVQSAKKLGVDSAYIGSNSQCGLPNAVADALAKQNLPSTVMVPHNFMPAVQNRSNVLGVFIGDEVDGDMGDNLRRSSPALSNKNYPEIPTYQGGKTNGHIGSYSGITDIQGMDAYIGACAPTIVPVIDPLPITYTYLYLKNTRNNHMPLPTWLYSQLYSQAWSYQAHGTEIAAQVAMTVIAGGKGVTLFQSLQQEIEKQGPTQLAPIQRALQSIKALKEPLRTGSLGGASISTTAKSADVLYDAIRSPEKLLFVVLNTKATGYSNLLCHVQVLGTHWKFSKQTVGKFQLKIPDGLSLKNLTEQIGQQTLKPENVQVELPGNTVTLTNMALDDVNPVRFFALDIVNNK